MNRSAVISVSSIIPNANIVATDDDGNEKNLSEIRDTNSTSVSKIPKKPAQKLLRKKLGFKKKRLWLSLKHEMLD